MNERTTSTNDLTELVQAVRLLAAAFPRAAWRAESEAVYAMALARYGVTPAVARAAISELIREQYDLPPVAQVLAYCHAASLRGVADVHCPECDSALVAVDAGRGLCFDCDWQGEIE